jgi:hypothetical protein
MMNYTTMVFIKTSHKLNGLSGKAMKVLKSRSGEGFVDTAVKILMSVVIGALVLAGLYLLFKDNILPTLTNRINDMFNFKG